MEHSLGPVKEKTENAGKAEGGKKDGKKGISGSTLKLIAIIAMFIDHTGAIIIERMLMEAMKEGTNLTMLAGLGTLDMVLRLTGRLGFPIFCYLLIEGFQYTKNVWKYAGRLFLFALVSEVPFDLGFTGSPFYLEYQNVFFTLFIGLLVLIGFRLAEEKTGGNRVIRILLSLLVLAAGAGAAQLLKTDYAAAGVLTIAVMYICRRKKMLETGLGCAVLTVMNPIEITAFFVMIPVHMYNGKRGWNIKWLFYAFYPLHILLLYGVACALGLGQVMLRLG